MTWSMNWSGAPSRACEKRRAPQRCSASAFARFIRVLTTATAIGVLAATAAGEIGRSILRNLTSECEQDRSKKRSARHVVSEVAFILGAGCSKEAGGPMTADFL